MHASEPDSEIRLDLRILFTKEFDCIVTSSCRHCISTFSVLKYNYLLVELLCTVSAFYPRRDRVGYKVHVVRDTCVK